MPAGAVVGIMLMRDFKLLSATCTRALCSSSDGTLADETDMVGRLSPVRTEASENGSEDAEPPACSAAVSLVLACYYLRDGSVPAGIYALIQQVESSRVKAFGRRVEGLVTSPCM